MTTEKQPNKGTIAERLEKVFDGISVLYVKAEALQGLLNENLTIKDVETLMRSLRDISLLVEGEGMKSNIMLGAVQTEVKHGDDLVFSLLLNRAVCEQIKQLMNFLLAIRNNLDAQEIIEEYHEQLYEEE